MLGSVFAKSLRDLRRSFVGWSLGLAGYVALIVAVYPTIRDNPDLNKLVESYPEALKAFIAFGGQADFTSAAGYLGSELFSFMIRPFSLGLRLFVAMTAGHILLKVLAGFVINGFNAGPGIALIVSLPSFLLMIGISVLELLVCAIQAYVFALLTSLYLNDAINLH